MFKHIVIALDGSDSSHEALKLAVGLSKDQGARCTIVSVVDIVRAAAPMAMRVGSIMPVTNGEVANQWVEALMDDAHQIVAEALQLYANSGVELDSVVIEGYPADAIIDVAKEHSADLIVTGSHGRSGVRRLLLGSVADLVVRSAHIPVLIVRS